MKKKKSADLSKTLLYGIIVLRIKLNRSVSERKTYDFFSYESSSLKWAFRKLYTKKNEKMSQKYHKHFSNKIFIFPNHFKIQMARIWQKMFIYNFYASSLLQFSPQSPYGLGIVWHETKIFKHRISQNTRMYSEK